MAKRVEVPSSFSVQFPGYCVYCCEPATKQREVEVEAHYQAYVGRKTTRWDTYKTKLKIPYCEKHFEEVEKLENMLYTIPAGIIGVLGLLAAIAWLIIGFLRGDFAQEVWWWKYLLHPILWMVGGTFAGALIGLLFGGFILHPILAIFLKTVRHTPILFHLFGGSLGFKAKFKKKGEVIRFRFANSSYAIKFVEANPGAHAELSAEINAAQQQHLENACRLEGEDKFEAALEECEAAIALAPGCAEAHNLHGVILDGLGRSKEAFEAYLKAVLLDPAFEDAQANLADAESELRASSR